VQDTFFPSADLIACSRVLPSIAYTQWVHFCTLPDGTEKDAPFIALSNILRAVPYQHLVLVSNKMLDYLMKYFPSWEELQNSSLKMHVITNGHILFRWIKTYEFYTYFFVCDYLTAVIRSSLKPHFGSLRGS
jgi:hypothetical protein